MLSKMSGWNVFMKTCAKFGDGDDNGPISHPFKEYSRERFPSAIIPPTKAEKALAEQMKQQGEPQMAPAQFVQAPQSIGSHVMIANPAAAMSSGGSYHADNTQYFAQQLQQQQQQQLLLQQQEQQQQMAMMYANPMAMQQQPSQQVPGMYYDIAPGHMQQQQHMQMQQYQSVEQQMQQQYMAHQPYSQYQQQTGMGGSSGGQVPMGQYWDGSNGMGMGMSNNGMLPMASPYGMSIMQQQQFQQQQQPQQPPPLDPNRPTYAQNAIGVEVAMRERMAALLATRQR